MGTWTPTGSGGSGGSSTSLTATSTGDPADYTSVIDVKAADATQVVACDTGGEFDVATTSVLGGYIQIRDSDTGRVAKISPSGSMIDVESGAAIDLEGFGSPVVRIEGHNTGAAGRLGFFGATPIAPPAAPVTLEDVIAALQALGLVAT